MQEFGLDFGIYASEYGNVYSWQLEFELYCWCSGGIGILDFCPNKLPHKIKANKRGQKKRGRARDRDR